MGPLSCPNTEAFHVSELKGPYEMRRPLCTAGRPMLVPGPVLVRQQIES